MTQATNGIHYPAIFVDGGVISLNPSPLGGTWAARLVEETAVGPAVLHEKSGLVRPAKFGIETISNNFTEAYAMMMGLRMLPQNWNGYVYSDSLITLGRFFQRWAWNNIPDQLRELCLSEAARVRPLGYMLLDGHPTKKQLAAGFGKRGNPCSEHNVWADHACSAQAAKFVAENGALIGVRHNRPIEGES